VQEINLFHLPYVLPPPLLPSVPPNPAVPLVLPNQSSQANARENPDKTTWWGCGNHVPSVMTAHPREEWCTCEPKVEKEGEKYPPMGAKAD